MMKFGSIQAVQAVQHLRRYESVYALVFLGWLAWLLHQSSLNGYWRFDDGAHLEFAAIYSPWQYFFQPSITFLQSYANVTPYNVFFYDVNLAMFGLAPRWHYAHLIAILAGTAFATYQFIRLWQPPLTALLAAVLFLAGLPTLHVAQQLMTGHYATGLLLTVLSLYCYSQGVIKGRFSLVLLGAALYLLATSCKEIFVPLVLALPFVPAGSRKSRFKVLWPYLAVAVFYTAWRYAVLGRLQGGYIASEKGLVEQFSQLISIPLFLSGWTNDQTLTDFAYRHHGLHVIAAALVFVLGFVANYRKQLSWALLFTAVLLLVLPLVPLTRMPGLTAADRYMFLLWWACAVLLAIFVGSLKNKGFELGLKLASVVFLVGLTVHAQRSEHERIARELNLQEVLYRAVLEADNNTALIVPVPGVLKGMRHAVRLTVNSNIEPAKLIVDKASLCRYAQAGNTILAFDESCDCIKDVTSHLDEALIKVIRTEAGTVSGAPMNGQFSLQGRVMSWKLGPYAGEGYSIILDGSVVKVGAKDSITFNQPSPVRFKIRHDGPDGKVAVSPELEFDTDRQSIFTWSGNSVVLAPSCSINPT